MLHAAVCRVLTAVARALVSTNLAAPVTIINNRGLLLAGWLAEPDFLVLRRPPTCVYLFFRPFNNFHEENLFRAG